MKHYDFTDVYFTLCGEMHGEDAVAGVENAFATGSRCDLLYNEMCEAYERLRRRLEVTDEDPDIEIILGNLLTIQLILCEKMYDYGKIL